MTDRPPLEGANPRPDRTLVHERALLVARLAVGIYLLELLLNLTRPRLQEHEPALTIFQQLPGDSAISQFLRLPEAVFWTLLVGIAVGLVLQVIAVRLPSEQRSNQLNWAILAALLGPFGLIPLRILVMYPLIALACVPSTAFALWLLHRGQQFGRLPVTVLLAAFGWGVLIVPGYVRACSSLAIGTITAYFGSSGDIQALLHRALLVLELVIFHVSLVSVLIQAAGIGLALLLFRHRITDLITGMVLGAAIGVGLNFSESVILIQLFGSLSSFTGATGGFEYWIRQSVTLFGGSLAFGALLGAAFGLAAQLPDRRGRATLVGAGMLAVIGAMSANEIVPGWFSHLIDDLVERGSVVDTLLVSPLIVLLVQAPFIVLAFLLLRSGLRQRAGIARELLAAEARTGRGAITPAETSVLGDPALRFWATVKTYRWLGLSAARALRRLHVAQFELIGSHWPQLGAEPSSEEALRDKVLRLKSAPSDRPKEHLDR
jgi:hypothetical protein